MVFMSALAITAADPAPTGIRGTALGNWWHLKETVCFKASGALPADITAVVAELRDSSGKPFSRTEITAQQFAVSGWAWQPSAPGFYEVKFLFKKADGSVTPSTATMPCKVDEWIQGKPHLRLSNDFIRSQHNFAVLPTPTRPPEEIPPQMALSLGPAHEKKPFRIQWMIDNIKLARQIGFHGIRIHTIAWSQIETEPGVYDWSMIDQFLDEAKKAGFREFYGNAFGTPKWASTRPDLINLNICVWEYAAFAPVKMAHWGNFLKTLVKRYPYIKTWELWNEPHLPGQSCFWSDSPDNFVEMLKTGYQAVKEVQPESTVWLGGIGMRYLPFYKEIMSRGAGKYFDVLPLHGSWVSPYPFQNIDRETGNKPKPWVSSEWHAMLTSSGQPVTPTEETLARDMLVDFMNHIRQGAELVTFFTTTNIQHAREIEMTDYFRKNKQFFQTFGLFRATPYIEPRLQAVVWRNFADCFAGKITYAGGYIFDKSNQRAALMRSDRGPVLFLWSNSDKDVKLCQEIASAVGKDSILLDWEGRTVSPAGLSLRPDHVYFLKNPVGKVVSGWTENGQILRQRQVLPSLDRSYNGAYQPGRLFDDRLNLTAGKEPKWLPLPKYVPANNQPAAEKFQGRFAVSMDNSGLDLVAEITDARHVQPHNDGKVWEGDSIQFALDANGNGLTEERLEFSAALTPNGPLLWKETMPSLGGDLPGRITYAKNPVRYGKIAIDKIPGGLRYKIHIDRDDLYPFSFLKGQPLRFAMLANNNNGNGREGFLEWGAGIGGTKDPALYGTLTVNVGSHVLFEQAALKHKWGAVALEIANGTAKATSTAGAGKTAAAVSTTDLKVESGVRYAITFQARGNIKLLGMCNVFSESNGTKRHDFMRQQLLNGEWRTFKESFIVPADAKKLNLSLFCWQEDGWFEIRDFKMAAE